MKQNSETMCDCINIINRELSKENLELGTVMIGTKRYVYLPTRKISSHAIAKRKILVKFCPECGNKERVEDK